MTPERAIHYCNVNPRRTEMDTELFDNERVWRPLPASLKLFEGGRANLCLSQHCSLVGRRRYLMIGITVPFRRLRDLFQIAQHVVATRNRYFVARFSALSRLVRWLFGHINFQLRTSGLPRQPLEIAWCPRSS